MPRFPAAAALALALAACGRNAPVASPPPSGPGVPAEEGRLAVDGGRIWYRVTGTGGGTPVILLHGGPGISSFYLKPFEALADERQVVRYDQLGGGKSDPLTDTTKMTIDHFVRELDSLRTHLGYPKVHLLGHSWGTLLAVEYYRAHPDRVASLTLESAFLDLPAWARNTRRLVGTLSDSARRAIQRAEAEGRYDTPAFEAADREYSARYMTRRPVQADGDSIRRTIDEAVYGYMQGPAEYIITGTLRDYDATPFLPSIRVPVLYTVGEFDEADPPTVRRFASLTPHARFVEFPGAAHLTPWDAREQNVAAVRAFLRRADAPVPRP